RLIAGEGQRLGAAHPAPADLFVVDVQGGGAALGYPAAVVGELHPDQVGTLQQRPGGVDVEPVDAVEVVAVREVTLLDVDHPATGQPALGDDHALAPAGRDHDLGADPVGLVLDVDQGEGVEPADAGVEP